MITISKFGNIIRLSTDECTNLRMVAESLEPLNIQKSMLNKGELILIMESSDFTIDNLRKKLEKNDIAGDIKWIGFKESPKEDHIQTFNPD